MSRARDYYGTPLASREATPPFKAGPPLPCRGAKIYFVTYHFTVKALSLIGLICISYFKKASSIGRRRRFQCRRAL